MNTRTKEQRSAATIKTAHMRQGEGVALGLSILSAVEAQKEGYVSISNEVCLRSEESLARSMAKGMRGVDAVWIRIGLHTPLKRHVELGRKKESLIPVDGAE